MYSDTLMHYGVKGQKWGVRRYQYADGSLTPAGRKRYSDDAGVSNGMSGLMNTKMKDLVNKTKNPNYGKAVC